MILLSVLSRCRLVFAEDNSLLFLYNKPDKATTTSITPATTCSINHFIVSIKCLFDLFLAGSGQRSEKNISKNKEINDNEILCPWVIFEVLEKRIWEKLDSSVFNILSILIWKAYRYICDNLCQAVFAVYEYIIEMWDSLVINIVPILI